MKFYYSISAQRFTIAIDGVVNPDFKFDEKINNILVNDSGISEIIFILRKTSYKEENDLKLFLNELKKLSLNNYEITLIECPKNILGYLIKNHSKESMKTIRSFMIPYYCDSCNEEKHQLINTSCLSLSFNAYKKPLCPTCNKHLSLDITDEEIKKIANMLPELDSISDKRIYPRYEISSYDLYFELTKSNEKYKILNFSQDGVSISGPKAIIAGTVFDFDFTCKSGKISSKGTVVWNSADQDSNFIHGVTVEDNLLYQLLMQC